MSAFDAMRGGLVVSVQAPPGSPLREPAHMAAIAGAAELGGARGIRADGARDIAAIKAGVTLPVIGLHKRHTGDTVLITPELDDALALAVAGADAVAVDATTRPRADGRSAGQFLAELGRELSLPVLADVDSFEAGVGARAAGAAAVATTLAGYTGGPVPAGPDVALVERLAAELDCPVIAEGRYATPAHVRSAFEAGAFAVVVGTAISDPTTLTRRLASASPVAGHPEHVATR